MLLISLIPIIGFTINILIQVLTSRYFKRIGFLNTVYLGFSMGLLGLFVMELLVYTSQSTSFIDLSFIAIANFITYSALGYCYFHFINLGETARRIRILRELYGTDTGLTMDEILARYNAKDIINNRLDRLLGAGQIVLIDGKYFIGSPIMLLISKTMVALRWVILGRKSELN